MQNRNLRCFLSQRAESSAAPSFVVPSVICLFSSFFSSSICLLLFRSSVSFSYEHCFISSVKMYLFYSSMICDVIETKKH